MLNLLPRLFQTTIGRSLYLVSHRLLAAFLAISFLFDADNFSALALPPFNPPNLPNSTAAGFLPLYLSGSLISPVDRSTINFANWFVSRGRFGVFAISQRYNGKFERSSIKGVKNQNESLPTAGLSLCITYQPNRPVFNNSEH